jgi:hypothetical protein
MPDYSTVNRDPDLGNYTTGLPVHPEYRNYIRRWKFLINSYMGGAQYKTAQYLTRYIYESENDYLQRIAQTPLDNHVKSVVHIFNSFLYRNEPKRDLGSLEGPELDAFFKDCDMEGRTFESFMRDVNIMSSVYGHVAVLVDRPSTAVGTRAEELEQGIRNFVSIYTPENILDWSWKRLPSGHYELDYVKFLESEELSSYSLGSYTIRTWTKDEIRLEQYMPDSGPNSFQLIESKPNPLGKIPVTWVYASRSPIRGIGVSDIGDIADQQNAIYNELSEIEQLIRISNAPSLVKTRDTDASAGAGAIITMPENLDPGLAPKLLQPNGQNLDSILKTIESKVKAIDRMAHLGAIRAIETRQMSGVAQQAEFQLLDAKLCEKAKSLQLAEEQIWRNWALWQGTAFDGEIKYPMAFHIRDKNLDMDLLQKAAATQRDSANASPDVKKVIDEKIKELLAKDEDELDEMNQAQPLNTTMTHPPMTNVGDMIKHMREMVDQGYTDEQIKELHPEMEKFFSNDSPQEL